MYEEKMRFELTVNRKKRVVYVHPSKTLLEVLREELNLTGTKKGCDDTNCGVCTVLMDGRAVKSCTILIPQAAGAFDSDYRGAGRAGRPASSATGVYRSFCRAVRLLYAGNDYDSQSYFGRESQGYGGRYSRGASWKSLPLYGL